MTGKSPSVEALRRRVAAGPPFEAALMDALASDHRKGVRALYERCRRLETQCATAARRIDAMWALEAEAQAAGYAPVAGADEAGRGALAGPLVAAAVVLAHPVPGLNDSKQLTPAQRDRLFDAILEGGHTVSVAWVDAESIDRWGIQQANLMALAQAASGLTPAAAFVLVDGFALPGFPAPHRKVIGGDRRSQSVAAASIVAKVTRDRAMAALDAEFHGYGFARHKGYGTRDHVAALNRLGPSPVHRRSFAPLAEWAGTGELFPD